MIANAYDPDNLWPRECNEDEHLWVYSYYGVRCDKCGAFVMAGLVEDSDIDESDDEAERAT